MTDFIPAEGFPPAEFIRDELVERSWSLADFAKACGLSLFRVERIVMDDMPIDARIAAAIGKAFGQDAQTWINLQASWDRWKAAQEKKR